MTLQTVAGDETHRRGGPLKSLSLRLRRAAGRSTGALLLLRRAQQSRTGRSRLVCVGQLASDDSITGAEPRCAASRSLQRIARGLDTDQAVAKYKRVDPILDLGLRRRRLPLQ